MADRGMYRSAGGESLVLWGENKPRNRRLGPNVIGAGNADENQCPGEQRPDDVAFSIGLPWCRFEVDQHLEHHDSAYCHYREDADDGEHNGRRLDAGTLLGIVLEIDHEALSGVH